MAENKNPKSFAKVLSFAMKCVEESKSHPHLRGAEESAIEREVDRLFTEDMDCDDLRNWGFEDTHFVYRVAREMMA